MSAREELYSFAMVGKEHSPDISQKMSDRIDAFAHELAEKIRAASATCAVFRSEDMQARADHGRRMADLIDPEVE